MGHTSRVLSKLSKNFWPDLEEGCYKPWSNHPHFWKINSIYNTSVLSENLYFANILLVIFSFPYINGYSSSISILIKIQCLYMELNLYANCLYEIRQLERSHIYFFGLFLMYQISLVQWPLVHQILKEENLYFQG